MRSLIALLTLFSLNSAFAQGSDQSVFVEKDPDYKNAINVMLQGSTAQALFDAIEDKPETDARQREIKATDSAICYREVTVKGSSKAQYNCTITIRSKSF